MTFFPPNFKNFFFSNFKTILRFSTSFEIYKDFFGNFEEFCGNFENFFGSFETFANTMKL